MPRPDLGRVHTPEHHPKKSYPDVHIISSYWNAPNQTRSVLLRAPSCHVRAYTKPCPDLGRVHAPEHHPHISYPDVHIISSYWNAPNQYTNRSLARAKLEVRS